MSENKQNKFEGLPNIDDYLIRSGDGHPVSTKELKDIIEIISAKTELTETQSEQILNLLFQEIRGQMLRGKIISISNFGKFYISSPKVSNNSRKIFPKFKPFRALLNLINKKY